MVLSGFVIGNDISDKFCVGLFVDNQFVEFMNYL